MKKICRLFTLLLLNVLSLATLFACVGSNSSSSSSSSSSETVAADLALDKATLQMIIGDEIGLKAFYNDVDGAEALAFTSADKDVATVSTDGTVTAMREGETTITASYGGETATCTVTVGTGGLVPVLEFEETLQSELVTYRAETVNLSTYVLFNGKEFSDAALTYAYSDETVGAVDENGLFTPAKTGTTTVTLTATWRGFESVMLEKSVEITVKAGTVVSVNDGQTEFAVYTVASHGGKTYETNAPFEVKVFEDDGTTPVTGWTAAIIEGAELLEYRNDTISSKGKWGTATIAVQGQDEIHGEIYHELQINIVRPVAESTYEGNLDAKDGSLDLDAMTKIFGTADTKVYTAESATTALTVKDGKILGFTQTENVAPKPQKITVYNDEVGYEISVKVYAGVLRTAEDFSKLICAPDLENTSFKTNVNTLTGYYILANDIDASGVEIPPQGKNIHGRSYDEYASVGFRGIFDGQGYTVSNLISPSYGVFGVIGQGAIIQNVAFTDVVHAKTWSYPIACYVCGATFRNVYISAAKLDKANTTLLGSNVDTNTSIENCVFEVKAFASPGSDKGYGIIGYMLDGSWKNKTMTSPVGWVNSYIIAPNTVVKSTQYSYVVDCEYVDGEKTSLENGAEYLNLTGIKRYTSWDKFIGDSAANEAIVSGFDTSVWNVDCGVPVWKTEKMSAVKFGEKVLHDNANIPYGDSGLLSVLGVGEGSLSFTATITSGNALELSNTSLGTTLKTVALGKATVRISYTYNGEAVTKEITVNVVKPETQYSATLNGGTQNSVTLVPNGDETATFAVNGTTATLEVLSGAECLEINGLTAKAVAGGKAVVRVKWTENTFDYYTDFEIISLPEAEDKTALTIDFDTSRGLFTESELKEIFGENETDTTIVYASLNGEELTVKDGAIFGFTVGRTQPTATEVMITTATRSVKLNVVPYSRIFRSADDLFTERNGEYYSYFDYFAKATSANYWTATFDGYYILGNDITIDSSFTKIMRQERVNKPTDSKGSHYYNNASTAKAGFIGTFDGRGYTIDGLTFGRMGMFLSVGRTATIKNVSFKNVKFSTNTNDDYANIFGAYLASNDKNYYVTIENVHISVASAAWQGNASFINSAVLANSATRYLKMNNVVLDLSGWTTTQRGLGSMFYNQGGFTYEEAKITNTYVISPTPLVVSTTRVDAANKANTYQYTTTDGVHKGTMSYWGLDTNDADGDGDKKEIYHFENVECTYVFVESIYRFDTVAEMKEYVAANSVDLSSFVDTYWDTSTGVPVWKN